MAHWYTADTHFGHENVIAFCNRPFKSAAHMDGVLLENMWKVVKPDDDLWIIGDFAFGTPAKNPNYLHQVFGQLPGIRQHLIVGNHDSDLTQALGWASVAHLAEVPDGLKSQRNTLCHYPMITWNHARRGALQLFGHVHNDWRGSRNSVNVGVDVWDFMPVTYDNVARRARQLPSNKHWPDVEHRSDL